MSIKVDNLTMKYLYGREAIKELSFECKKGERLAVLATAEGGKTSLLRCIAGLYPATSGDIYIDGKNITTLKPKKRNTLMIYHDGGILKSKNVRFHLEYPLKLRKINRVERKKRVNNVAREFDIYPYLNDIGRMLYKDDVIRLSFARAAIREAAVYLIDDPFKQLSGGERDELFREMLPHIRNLKGSVIYATSSVDEAFSVADRVLVLNYGRQEQLATPEEITSSPASLVVDKLVNPHHARVNCVAKIDSNGVYAQVAGKRIDLDKEHKDRDITLSFAIKESSTGELALPSSHGYIAGRRYVSFANGATLFVNQPLKDSYLLAPQGKIHVFDNTTEKRLTSII